MSSEVGSKDTILETPTNGIARPLAMPQVPTTPTPGTRTPSRKDQSPGNTEQAQSSRKGNQVHRTDSDPWAIQ